MNTCGTIYTNNLMSRENNTSLVCLVYGSLGWPVPTQPLPSYLLNRSKTRWCLPRAVRPTSPVMFPLGYWNMSSLIPIQADSLRYEQHGQRWARWALFECRVASSIHFSCPLNSEIRVMRVCWSLGVCRRATAGWPTWTSCQLTAGTHRDKQPTTKPQKIKKSLLVYFGFNTHKVLFYFIF